jgi:predicted transcriptional regulator
MNENEYLKALDIEYQFNKRLFPISPELRPVWKLAILVLILSKCCMKNTCSFQKIQVLCWAVKNKKNQKELLDFVTTQNINLNFNMIVRYEPSVNRIIDIALAENFIEQVGGDRIRLTDKGKRLAEEIDKANDLLISEKNFFKSLGKKRLSEKLLLELTKGLKTDETKN